MRRIRVNPATQDLYEIMQMTRRGYGIGNHCFFTDGESSAIEDPLAPEILACGGIDVSSNDSINNGLLRIFRGGK